MLLLASIGYDPISAKTAFLFPLPVNVLPTSYEYYFDMPYLLLYKSRVKHQPGFSQAALSEKKALEPQLQEALSSSPPLFSVFSPEKSKIS